MAAVFTGFFGYGSAIAGDGILEPSDAGYARQAVTLSDLSNFDPSVNLGPMIFGPFAAASGPLTCAGLFDAVSGGNCVAYWPLQTGRTVTVGRTFVVPTGEIKIQFSQADTILGTGSVAYQPGQRIGKVSGGSPVNAGSAAIFTV